ncbi:lysozyme inhibitor LprI family protein [Amphritea japonica]|uniref:Lysozyme inhibitor LprI-like N-terminal domain-containing protein n=1 Tax=Amphritea japonica ATCC BAA-1530 TaxID=1278309 RepID=A0A7R6P364_9GAMM|nr:lysozyme inhibitor LprI family protein [Amphritea japonica]BBB26164.1 conserved hypothetical protein [Amphritea japonica ATCC BAA-1530]
MRLPFFLLSVLALTTASVSCNAESKQPLESEVVSQPVASEQANACRGSSHIEQVQCLSLKLKEQDVALNQLYDRVIERLPENDESDLRKERHQLVSAQQAWLKYRDEHCAFVGAQEGGSNLWVTHFVSICVKEETDKRIEFLNSFVN